MAGGVCGDGRPCKGPEEEPSRARAAGVEGGGRAGSGSRSGATPVSTRGKSAMGVRIAPAVALGGPPQRTPRPPEGKPR